MKRTTVTTYRYDADGKHIETVVTVTEEDGGGTPAHAWSPNVWPPYVGGGTSGGTWGGYPFTVNFGGSAARA